MQLPQTLRRAIEQLAQGHPISSLAQAANRISAAYRANPAAATQAPAISTGIERVAYVATRMPATYAASYAVLEEIRGRLPNLAVKTLLDLGAGPGTASWAAAEIFPSLREVQLLERDASFADLGRSLAAHSESGALRSAIWKQTDLSAVKAFPPHDLVILSYSIGELQSVAAAKLLQAAWTAAQGALAIIEPGTPAGFARIRMLRDELLQRGGHMVAPCPHASACPMAGDNWCHFAARVERSSLHRRVKGGTLGYEDEKYSYVALSKFPAQIAQARIIRHPMHHPGFTELRLCTAESLRNVNVSRKHREDYRRAKKSSWGGAWELQDSREA